MMITERSYIPQDGSTSDEMISSEVDSSSIESDVLVVGEEEGGLFSTLPKGQPLQDITSPIASSEDSFFLKTLPVEERSPEGFESVSSCSEKVNPCDGQQSLLSTLPMEEGSEVTSVLDVPQQSERYSFESLFTSTPRVVDGRQGGSVHRRGRSRKSFRGGLDFGFDLSNDSFNYTEPAASPDFKRTQGTNNEQIYSNYKPEFVKGFRPSRVSSSPRPESRTSPQMADKCSTQEGGGPLFGTSCRLPAVDFPISEFLSKKGSYNKSVVSPSHRCTTPTTKRISLHEGQSSSRCSSRGRTTPRLRNAHSPTSDIPLYRIDLMSPDIVRESRQGTVPSKGERRRSSSARVLTPRVSPSEEEATAALKKFDSFRRGVLSQYIPSPRYPPSIQPPKRVRTPKKVRREQPEPEQGIFTRTQGLALLDTLQVEVDELKILKQRIAECEHRKSSSPLSDIKPLKLHYC